MEPAEEQSVAASTLAREAYFVDFARAMKQTISVPLMVTGGFRSRAAMEEALAQGAADVIGLARPLCEAPDGAAQLLAGAAELPRSEKSLALFPTALSFLTRIKPLRAISSFAVQFWYYSQIYALGRTGQTDPAKSVFGSLLEVERTQKAWLKARRGNGPVPS